MRENMENPELSLLEGKEEMRRSGYAVIDSIVERWSAIGEHPAWQGAPRDVMEPKLHGPAPEEGRDLAELLDTISKDVMPFAGQTYHPRYFAFIPSSPTWASILASFLADAHNVVQANWREASGPSQIEVTVLDWFRKWLRYPKAGSGVLTSGGSAANLIAIVAARETAGNPDTGTIYLSGQTHSSIPRAARIAGISPDRIRIAGTDEAGRIIPASLRAMIRQDRNAGKHPFLVVGNAGTTNTGAIDPLENLADIAHDEKLWYHVDAAYGGFAILDRETAPRMSGIRLADSVTLDPHKWFFQPYETGCLMVRNPDLLEHVFRAQPEYMQDSRMGPLHVNFSDRGIQLSRMFRALRIWLAVQRYGVGAHRKAISYAIELGKKLEARVERVPELELLAPQTLSIVCFRYRGMNEIPEEQLDELNRRIQTEIVNSGFAMMTSTELDGRFSLRLCILNYRTTEDDLAELMDRIVRVGNRLLAERSAKHL